MAAHLGSKYRRRTLLVISALSLLFLCAVRIIVTLVANASTADSSNPGSNGLVSAALTSISDNLIASLLGTIVVFLVAAYLWPESDHSHELRPKEIRPSLLDGVESTSHSYKFRGRTASFFCSRVLPRLFAISKDRQKTIIASVQLLDPDNELVCEIYAKHRKNIGHAKGEEGLRFVQAKIATNILAIYGQKSGDGKVNVDVWLSGAFSTFRLDISESAVVITREAEAQPGIRIASRTPSYDLYVEDYNLSELQSRRLPDLRDISLSKMTAAEVPAALLKIGVKTSFNLEECRRILEEAKNPRAPYA